MWQRVQAVSTAVVQTCLDIFVKLVGKAAEEWIYEFCVSSLLWLHKERVSIVLLVNKCWGDQQWQGQGKDVLSAEFAVSV